MSIRWLRANNASSMTLDGTRTYLVGTERVAIIDPGPLLDEHMDAVADDLGGGVCVSVLVTHSHPDHAEAAQALARRLNARLQRAREGDVIDTDAGPLNALATPGHTADHISFWHEASRSVFCGDLMMGGLDTALVAPPEGNLPEYLDSLERLRQLDPAVIYPAHGDPIHDADAAIERYVQHRQQRVQQVVDALQHGAQTPGELADRIYGSALDDTLRGYAASAVEAYLLYLEHEGRVTTTSEGWKLT